jgi:hypothetical protein
MLYQVRKEYIGVGPVTISDSIAIPNEHKVNTCHKRDTVHADSERWGPTSMHAYALPKQAH